MPYLCNVVKKRTKFKVMKTKQITRHYQVLPKKYRSIPSGSIFLQNGYAYAVKHAAYSYQKDYVYRITENEYNLMCEDAKSWDCYKCEKTEENLNLQIWCYITGVIEIEPYIIA